MLHIEELRGSGIGKRCVCIGGGASVKEIDIDALPPDVVRLNANYPFHGAHVDYMTYFDAAVLEQFKKHGHPRDCKVIGYDRMNEPGRLYPQSAYRYNYYDIDNFFDTGSMLLTWACKLFKYDEIYIIGYDYMPSGDHVHYYDDGTTSEERERYHTYMFSRGPAMYDRLYGYNVKTLTDRTRLKFPRATLDK